MSVLRQARQASSMPLMQAVAAPANLSDPTLWMVLLLPFQRTCPPPRLAMASSISPQGEVNSTPLDLRCSNEEVKTSAYHCNGTLLTAERSIKRHLEIGWWPLFET